MIIKKKKNKMNLRKLSKSECSILTSSGITTIVSDEERVSIVYWKKNVYVNKLKQTINK